MNLSDDANINNGCVDPDFDPETSMKYMTVKFCKEWLVHFLGFFGLQLTTLLNIFKYI